ncbi:hypothetical protein ACIOHC_24245 [Streptomyces sp. NPDC088252]|uniref:hypothetical protein n=1 Tax=unclassified Streptomyces TaxID=2593676 RepID=UPI00382409D7
MADDPNLTGRVRLDLTGLIEGLRFARALTNRQISRLVRDANQRLRSLDTTRLTTGLSRVAGMIGGLGRLAAPFAMAGAAVGSLIPLLAGVASALQQMAPAAALAVSGVLAIGLAAGTLKLAMSGVSDAVKAALDPSDPEAYAEALKKLSPNARAFVQEIHKAQPALDAIKKTVQDKVFAGLDKQLASTGKVALPVLKRALSDTAGTLNQMGKGVLTAVRGLAKDGTLGTALRGATSGLNEFRRAPGQVVTALGQIGAAAAPAFKRVSKAGGTALDRLSAKIAKAFESGGMEKAINGAIDLLAQLGRVVGNVGAIFGNMFKAVSQGGDGLFGTLEKITGALRSATATPGFQRALLALSQTMGVVASTVAPLLGQALGVLGPVVEALAGPAQQLVRVLGDALSRVMTALGPVLASLARAFGNLVVSLLPLVDVAGTLIAALLPALVPLFDALSQVFVALAPVIQQIATNLSAQLVPILESLAPILAQILPPFVQLAQDAGPQLTEMLARLTPGFVDLSTKIAALWIQMAPLIAKVLELQVALAEKLLPIILPVVGGLVMLITTGFSALVDILSRYVVPAIQFVVAVLQGDFSGAVKHATTIVSNFKEDALKAIKGMADQVGPLLARFAAAVGQYALDAGHRLVDSIRQRIAEALGYFRDLPSRIRGAIPSAGSILTGIGRSIVQGLVDGIRSAIPSVQSVLSGLTDMIPNWKGPKRKDATLLTPAGKSIIKGLVAGIDASTASLKSKLTSITNTIERAITINKGNRKKVGGLDGLLRRVNSDNKRLIALAKQRDSAAARLKAAQKRLDDAIKERSKAAADIRDGILGDANITTGNNVVNSVSAITVGLQLAVKKTQDFAANLAKLKKAGLRSDLLGDIANAGVEGGAATAEALARATPAELKRINDLQAQLAKAASSTGTSVASALYDSGVKAAQGLVDGLKRQQGAIEKQMERIATAMVKAMKKALKIKSPSRVFMGIGQLSGDGLREGMLRSRAAVAAASASMANAAVGAADVAGRAMRTIPAPGQLTTAYAGATGGGDTHNTFNLYGTETRPDDILRALSWRGLVGRR